MSRTFPRRGVLLAAGLGALAFGGVVASAASLGTITSNSLGAGVAVVASCDTDGVALAYTNSFDNTSGRYRVASVTVSGMNAACAGKSLNVTLKQGLNATGAGTVASIVGTSEVVTITGNTDAGVVDGAAVVIAG